ncbi:hypothetical protein FGIG_12200, partial [Fasciola gigantica]
WLYAPFTRAQTALSSNVADTTAPSRPVFKSGYADNRTSQSRLGFNFTNSATPVLSTSAASAHASHDVTQIRHPDTTGHAFSGTSRPQRATVEVPMDKDVLETTPTGRLQHEPDDQQHMADLAREPNLGSLEGEWMGQDTHSSCRQLASAVHG